MEEILEERKKTHGEFKLNSMIFSELLLAVQVGVEKLPPPKQIAVIFMLGKISRIVAGDPYHEDHWKDIMGYAQLGLETRHQE